MLELEVPVHLVGTPIGVKNSGGVLQLSVHDLHVRCLPSKIPTSIDVDVSALDIGDSIHVADLTVSEGVEILADQELTICSVAAPRVAEATGEAAEGEAAEDKEGEEDDD
jgi:large subunit ribosomal protein L25